MKIAALLSVIALVACTARPPTAGTSFDDAANACQTWAYQQTDLVWLGAVGTVMAKDTPEYRRCMANAGFPTTN